MYTLAQAARIKNPITDTAAASPTLWLVKESL